MTTPRELPTAPLAYFAESIDRASGPGFAGYRIIPALAANGLTVFRPATAWGGGNHHPAYVEDINRRTLYHSDVLVADLQSDCQSFGVPMEIEAATSHGIHAVVLWTPGRARSVALQANSNVTFVELWEDAVSIATQLAERHRADRGYDIEPPTLKLTMALGHEAPRPAFSDDSGFDLVTAVDTEIPGHSFVDIPTTITGVQCPPGTWLLITGRSSAIRKRGLLVPNGVIDHGWRGPLMAGVYNLGTEPVTVLAGERVAQVILMPNATEQVDIVKVEQLDPHQRGLAGFGSTGVTLTPPPLVAGTEWARPPAVPVELTAEDRTRIAGGDLLWASEGEKAQALG